MTATSCTLFSVCVKVAIKKYRPGVNATDSTLTSSSTFSFAGYVGEDAQVLGFLVPETAGLSCRKYRESRS